jgi:hypothetical protein
VPEDIRLDTVKKALQRDAEAGYSEHPEEVLDVVEPILCFQEPFTKFSSPFRAAVMHEN